MAKIKLKVVEYYSFYCPGCNREHAYPVNSDGSGWQISGSIESPSFTPSLLNELPVVGENGEVTMKERCHLFLRNGRIEFLSDCFHEYAGQMVDLPEI